MTLASMSCSSTVRETTEVFPVPCLSAAVPSNTVAARSERFAAKAVARDKIEAQTVRDAMTTDPISVAPDTSMQDAAALLLNKKLGRLMVVDGGGGLVGLLSCTDMMDLVLSGELDMH